MRTRALASLAALVLSVPLLTTAAADGGLDELDDYPRPTVTGAAMADAVDAFASGHALRITATPTQLAGLEFLAGELEALGYDVQSTQYKGVLTSLTATKRGTDRAEEHLVLGSHVDSMVGTVTGHYDDASGVMTVLELARALRDVPTHRSVVFSFYNGEEQGALGSDEHARALRAAGTKIKAYLGFDMVGIAWPVGVPTTDDHCLCMWRGERDERFDDLLREINFEHLGFPEGRQQVSVEGENVRNSDEASFAAQGFPTLRWAGMRTAADYPGYHLPNDTMATIEETAGGREFFAQGLRNTLLSAYYTLAALDLEDEPAPAPAAVTADLRDRRAVHTPLDGHTH